MQCHYEVLGVDQDADNITIKKAHRKLAIKLHPDKNLNDEDAVEKFRLVQEAYECLSDTAERKWYDEHRDALLKGWSPNDRGEDGAAMDMLFDVIPFMNPAAYHGYEDSVDQNFFQVYTHVFTSIAKEEADAVGDNGEYDINAVHLPFNFGDSTTDWSQVAKFYQIWDSFMSRQSFAWADQYDVKEAESRRVRRAMEDENKKARKTARKSRNEDVLALVRFVKRRDPRMKALREKQEQERAERERQQEEERKLKKQKQKEAREEWKKQAHHHMSQTEEMDRLKGRVRLADLEDDYDYGGGKKKGKKGKNKKKQAEEEESDSNDNDEQEQAQAQQQEKGDEQQEKEGDEQQVDHQDINTEEIGAEGGEEKNDEDTGDDDDDDDDDESEGPELDSETDQGEIIENSQEELEESESSEEEEEPDVWRCECCRKDFKSEGQMENHMKSKKHKEAFKKYQKKIEQMMMKE